MEVFQIPSFIRQAGIFSPEELKRLASIERLPSESEIDAFRYHPDTQELMNAFIGDSDSRLTHQLIKAREYIQMNQISLAWKIALI